MDMGGGPNHPYAPRKPAVSNANLTIVDLDQAPGAYMEEEYVSCPHP